MLSLLGLVVFPHDAARKHGEPALPDFGDLEPSLLDSAWHVRIGPLDPHRAWRPLNTPLTTEDLLFHFRNAHAHNDIRSSGDARTLEETRISFINRQRRSRSDTADGPAKSVEVNRQIVMQTAGNELLTFCRTQSARWQNAPEWRKRAHRATDHGIWAASLRPSGASDSLCRPPAPTVKRPRKRS